MLLTYIQQSGSPPVGDGGDQYTGLDRFGRVIDQRWIKDSSGADLERVEYGFDRASNRVWRDNTVADALSAKQDEYYTYDGLNQLLTLQRGTLNSGKTGITGTPTWEEDFTFDPTGNWNNYVNQVSGTTTLNQPRTHNAVNEVETISGSSALIQQNAAGNMVKAPQPTNWSSAYTMTYDAWQRLVKVKSGSTTTAIYVYDGQNRRVTKVTGSTTRHYYYSSQWQILEERLNTTTTADRQFVWGLMGIDDLILRDRGTERFYSLQDVFNCTAIVDVTGTVQERYGYNAFGLSRVMDADFNVISTSSYDWETRYACYRFDSESSFYQVRNRYLHPTLGRWLTRDPIGYNAGINLYAYVINRSVNVIDSSGLAPKLSKKTIDQPIGKDCGEFNWSIKWMLDMATTIGGYIVQHVSVTFDATDCKGNKLSKADIKKKSGADPDWWPLWEAWKVDKNKTVTIYDGLSPFDDQYHINGLGDNTCGKITIIGSADFYDGLILPTSFQDKNAPPAGILPVTNTDPKLTGGSGAIKHNLTSEWNCCPDSKDKKSKVTTE